jgi:hypothetical protein
MKDTLDKINGVLVGLGIAPLSPEEIEARMAAAPAPNPDFKHIAFLRLLEKIMAKRDRHVPVS